MSTIGRPERVTQNRVSAVLKRPRKKPRALIEAGLMDCMAALPGQLFYSAQMPVCLWFLAKNKNADSERGFRDHLGFETHLALAA